MHWVIRPICWLSLFGLVSIQGALADSHSQELTTLTVRTVNGWTLVESSNFRCWSQLTEIQARQLAESCETWRSRLRATWISEGDQSSWRPKCDVYVHSTRAGYNQTLGRAGDMSVGSTIMNFDQGRTIQRRIDVRSDASDWSNAALPHELTHVVLGERFKGHALPRWADEGIAMLSESADKHRERLDNLQQMLSGRSTLLISDLTSATRLPAPHLRDAFYGQSLALSSLLIRKSSPARFADFVEDSITTSMTAALRKHYALAGLDDLQREWNDWVSKPSAVTFVSLPIQVGREQNIATIMP